MNRAHRVVDGPVHTTVIDVDRGRARRYAFSAREMSIDVLGPADPEGEIRAAATLPNESDPGFWATLWPASVALSAWLARTMMITPGMRIAELGAGLGLPSLVCARRRCAVLAIDRFGEALRWIELSAAHNGLAHRVRVRQLDITQPDAATLLDVNATAGQWPTRHHDRPQTDGGDAPDFIIAADLLYHDATRSAVASLIDHLACSAAIALPLREGSGVAEGMLVERGFQATTLDHDVRLLLRS